MKVNMYRQQIDDEIKEAERQLLFVAGRPNRYWDEKHLKDRIESLKRLRKNARNPKRYNDAIFLGIIGAL